MTTTTAKKRRRNRRRGGGSGAPPAVSVQPGLFADRYRAERLLGRGSYKTVYQAFDTYAKRNVALGIYHQPGQAATKFIARYNAVRDCGPHGNIAEVFDAGTGRGPDETVWTFVAMQLVHNAQPADEAVRQHGGPLPVPSALRYAHGILSGLRHLHESGLVHGACHARNVLVDGDGYPVVTDHDWTLPAGTSRIEPGELVSVLGAHQVEPEQLRGKPYDQRSDLYIAGIGIYLVSVGRYPFGKGDLPYSRDTSHDLIGRIDRLPETPLWLNPKLPQLFSDLLLRLLTPAPDFRPQSAAEALKELECIALPFHQ